MYRKLLAALAALGASACTYGSAVDIAPFKDRPAHPPLPAGYYCGAKGAQGAYMIASGEDCGRLDWDGAQRVYIIKDKENPKDDQVVAVIVLGGGLHAVQYEEPKDQKADGGPKLHHLTVAIISGKAFSSVSALEGDDFEAALKRHPKLTIGHVDKTPYIAAGEVSEIKAFLKDATAEALRQAKAKGDETAVIVLDRPMKSDHPASRAQIKDIEAVKAIVETLTPKG